MEESIEIIAAQCPKCGANFQPDEYNKTIICQYCQTPIIIKKASDFKNKESVNKNGYELFWDGKKVGHEPFWTVEAAISNLVWNMEQHPTKEVIGLYNGVELNPGEPSGDYLIPPIVSVLPVFFIPKNEKQPGEIENNSLVKHLKWAQSRYSELLGGHTFSISDQPVLVYQAEYTSSVYQGLKGMISNQIAGELLRFLKLNRFSCPFVLFTVFRSDRLDFPQGQGRPFNGGFNTGGGISIVSSYALNQIPNFQSTVQHELGHAFGLPHVDAYGYDMKTCDSIMSYNLAHHTREFSPSSHPGIFIAEDLRGLALNQRVFPGFRFPNNVNVAGINSEIKTISRMDIFEQNMKIKVSTSSGEAYSSRISNILQNVIKPSNENDGKVTYDKNTMWHSDLSANGWVSLEIIFPQEVALTAIGVHSQHSGIYHKAETIQVEVINRNGRVKIGEYRLNSIDQRVTFPLTTAKTWKLSFKTTSSKYLVLRGLQFFSGSNEIYPPLIPWNFN